MTFQSEQTKADAAEAERARISNAARALAEQALLPVTRREAAEIAGITANRSTIFLDKKFQRRVQEMADDVGE